jgi:single-stranded-DNA-specific exonuclease
VSGDGPSLPLMQPAGKRLQIDPCPADAAERLRAEAGLSRVLADALVRRGRSDPDEALAFLGLEGPLHDPLRLGDAATAIPLLRAAIHDRRRIVVHGDYDADGVCATALLCEGLRALGGDAVPFVPSRFDEGYGLAVETVERLHAEGAQLIVTVDCGITAVVAAERARALGVELIVTDHHRPGDDLPDCPIVAPAHGGTYPFEGLCGAGTAFKLLQGLVGACEADPAILDGVLDLVAIATIADLVPLVDENRALARAGLRRIGENRRPGLDALLRVAKVDPRVIDAGAIGFRVAPRLNAAGRLEHAESALRLLTTDDPREAHALAEELDGLNRRRRAIEDRILREALDLHAGLPDARRDALGLVLASDGWHPGVVGIVASRVVERLRRPVVLVALDGETGTGSGRSVEPFDLHAGLAACDHLLERWGGHRAAAGVTVRVDRVDAFADAFAAHATAELAEADLRPIERVDAVASLADVTLETAADLGRLEPVGMGNAGIAVLLPAVELAELRRIGSEGRHLDLRVKSGAGSCRAVAWGMGERAEELATGGRFDVVARIERSVWQGAERVELIARTIQPLPEGLAVIDEAGDDADALDVEPPPLADGVPVEAMVDRRDGGAIAELTRLAASGGGLVIVVADVARRRAMLEAALHPSRFGLRGAVLLSRRTGADAIAARLELLGEGPYLVLADHATLTLHPEAVRGVPDGALLDPPPGPWTAPTGPRWVRLDGPAEHRFATGVRAARAGTAAR